MYFLALPYLGRMSVPWKSRVTSLCTPQATGLHSIAQTISLSILRYRDFRGMSQSELAQLSGVSRGRLNELEAGREGGIGLHVVTLMRLCGALATTPDCMLGYCVDRRLMPGVFAGLL